MHRLFVAVRPPVSIRNSLLELMDGVRNARWQDDGQLHLTLRFIGEVDRHRGEDAAAALGGIRHRGFEIALDGIGSFDRNGRGALWAGVRPHEPLHSLHKKVDGALARIGIAPDRRAFHPHITLARLGRSAGSIEGFANRHAGLSSAPFAVEEFCLYESHLGSAGAAYEIVERYRLS